LVPVRETLVIDSKLVEDRRLHVVNAYWILHHFVAELVGLAVNGAAFESAAGQPKTVARTEVIATVGIPFRHVALSKYGPAKLAAPEDNRVV
jgi:hypothetical protein